MLFLIKYDSSPPPESIFQDCRKRGGIYDLTVLKPGTFDAKPVNKSTKFRIWAGLKAKYRT
jgi:hypothetical protein